MTPGNAASAPPSRASMVRQSPATRRARRDAPGHLRHRRRYNSGQRPLRQDNIAPRGSGGEHPWRLRRNCRLHRQPGNAQRPGCFDRRQRLAACDACVAEGAGTASDEAAVAAVLQCGYSDMDVYRGACEKASVFVETRQGRPIRSGRSSGLRGGPCSRRWKLHCAPTQRIPKPYNGGGGDETRTGGGNSRPRTVSYDDEHQVACLLESQGLAHRASECGWGRSRSRLNHRSEQAEGRHQSLPTRGTEGTA